MERNPRLKPLILEVVEKQLKANDPPETRTTLERLIEEGYPEEKAKELIGCVVTSEIFNVMKNKKEFNPERYRTALAKLPQMPWD